MIEKISAVFVERRNQYIWLTIYSDLITNLFLLFLSLYALSYFGPDAIPDAMASMKTRLEYSHKAAPWYEDITKNMKLISDQAAPVIAREDRLQMSLPEDVLFETGAGELKDQTHLWVISYSDFMTILMIFFLMLFAHRIWAKKVSWEERRFQQLHAAQEGQVGMIQRLSKLAALDVQAERVDIQLPDALLFRSCHAELQRPPP